MDSSSVKYYSAEAFDPKIFLNTYFSATMDDKCLQAFTVIPIKKLLQIFTSEYNGGDTLIDISVGPMLAHLFPVCKFFEKIIILEYNEPNIKEQKKWMCKDPDAHDWSFASKVVAQLENTSFQDIEDMLRKKLKDIVMCNLANKKPASPCDLPMADCILCSWLLDVVSKDHSHFRRNLKHLSSLLKIGGYLILFTNINSSFFMVGDYKCHMVNNNEDVLRKALLEEGYLIKHFEEIERVVPNDQFDIKQIIFVFAQKQRDIAI